MKEINNYGEWKVVRVCYKEKWLYAAGRQLDKNKCYLLDNYEIFGHPSSDETEVRKIVIRLNAQEKEARQLAYFKENSTSVLYAFCNKCQYFTGGTPKQYKMFFDRAKNAPEAITCDQYLRELSAMLWICSDGKDSVDTIRGVLFSEYLRVTAPIE